MARDMVQEEARREEVQTPRGKAAMGAAMEEEAKEEKAGEMAEAAVEEEATQEKAEEVAGAAREAETRTEDPMEEEARETIWGLLARKALNHWLTRSPASASI